MHQDEPPQRLADALPLLKTRRVRCRDRSKRQRVERERRLRREYTRNGDRRLAVVPPTAEPVVRWSVAARPAQTRLLVRGARLLNSYVPRSLFYCAFGRRLADALTPFALSQS